MNQEKITRLFLLILLVGMFACKSKEQSCEAFNNAFRNDFSYIPNDTLQFTSTNNETELFYIVRIESSPAYSYSCKDLHGICPCEQYLRAIARNENEHTYFILAEMILYKNGDVQYFNYTLFDYSFEFDYTDADILVEHTPSISYHEQIEINNSPFYWVYVQEVTKSQKITKIYFNKSIGIIGYKDVNEIYWHIKL